MDNITHDFVIMSKNGWFSSAKESIDIAIDAIRDAILEKKTTASFEIFYAGEVKQYLNAVFGGVFDITYANRVKAHVTVRINLDYITMPTSDYVDVCRAISNTKTKSFWNFS